MPIVYTCVRNNIGLVQLRELDPVDFGSTEVTPIFSEFSPYDNQCSLPNCTHTHEPDCGVKKAVVLGHISRSRYESFLKLIRAKGEQTQEKLCPHKPFGEVSFTCLYCGKEIPPHPPGTKNRNHCPFCLYSKHEDFRAGDRASFCGDIMEPGSIWARGNEWTIIHRCVTCGTFHSNRIAGDDNEGILLSLAVKPLTQPPFRLEYLRLSP